MGKSTISMAIFHCYVTNYQRVTLRCDFGNHVNGRTKNLLVLSREFSGMIHWPTINNNPSNPQQPIHSLTNCERILLLNITLLGLLQSHVSCAMNPFEPRTIPLSSPMKGILVSQERYPVNCLLVHKVTNQPVSSCFMTNIWLVNHHVSMISPCLF